MNITCDVLVFGGGASGIAAAYSSALAGARTILVEKNREIGGISTSGIVNCIAGIFADSNNTFLNNGFVPYFAKILTKNKINKHVFSNNRYSVLLYHPTAFLENCEYLIKSLKNIEYINNSAILKVTKKYRNISRLEITSGNKHIFISPKYVIDCTGDGELSFIAGAKSIENKHIPQDSGFGFSIKNVNTKLFFKSDYLAVMKYIAKSPSLKHIAPNVAFLRSLVKNELVIKFSIDTGSTESLTKAINSAYDLHKSLSEFCLFKHSSVSKLCPKIYNRESRRILGEYILNETDVLNCKKHSDEAARSNWPIELWYNNNAPQFSYLPDNDYYTVPLRSLLVKGFSNLMVAGRCISASQKALGSTRVIGTCLAIGEFCGLASAISSRKNTALRNIDIDEIQHIRKKGCDFYLLGHKFVIADLSAITHPILKDKDLPINKSRTRKNMNLFNIIKTTADKYPSSTAIIYKDTFIDYENLLLNIESRGNLLKKLGIGSGHRIGLICQNSPDYIILSFAILYCNACIVPISEKFKHDEIEGIINNVKLSHLIIENKINTHLALGLKKPIDKSFSLITFKNVQTEKLFNIKPAFIRFTSGTTSECKGVVLSHETIVERIKAANKALLITQKDIILWVLPMSYHFAVSVVLYLIAGACIIICDENTGQTMYDIIKKYKATIIYGSPFHYNLLSQIRNKSLLKNIRLALSTTSALPDSVFKAFYNKFKFPISQCYGIIEIGLPAINITNPYKKRKTVGLSLPDYKISIINPSTKKECGINETGMITIKGPGFLDAYFKPPKSRKKILKKGWFITGDYGKLDKDGYLTIEGRHNNLINVAGFKFFPPEVEDVLNSHPMVEESKVYGFYHPRFGEIPIADVILKKENSISEYELLDHIRKHLASFKIPFSINFVKSIEKTPSGKIKRT